MGRGRGARRRVLVPVYEGSNPSAPARRRTMTGAVPLAAGAGSRMAARWS